MRKPTKFIWNLASIFFLQYSICDHHWSFHGLHTVGSLGRDRPQSPSTDSTSCEAENFTKPRRTKDACPTEMLKSENSNCLELSHIYVDFNRRPILRVASHLHSITQRPTALQLPDAFCFRLCLCTY